MATAAEAESGKGERARAEDYLLLAEEALAKLADLDCARHLLTQAEMQCQLPADFVATVRAFVVGLGDRAYARELLKRAEQFCCEGGECAQVGHPCATLLDDRDRGRELLQQAVDETAEAGALLPRAADGVAGTGLSGQRNRLAWAEGRIDLFSDRCCAAEAHDRLRDESVAEHERVLNRYSRQHRLKGALAA